MKFDLDIIALEQANSNFLSEFLNHSKEEFGTENFTKWFAHLTIFLESEAEIIFSAPSKFVRDWIIREFIESKTAGKNLKNVVQNLRPQVKKVSVIYVAKASDDIASSAAAQITNPEAKVVNLSKYDNVFTLGTELNPSYTFANFVTAKYNKFALSMAKIAAGLDEQTNLFDTKIPLFIHGNVGLGKTHLAQAIAWQMKEANKTRKVVYLSAEKFMFHFVQSIRGNDVMGFKEKMRSIDVLIVDDVQFIAGKESTQQEFMNSFNSLVAENKQVVLVCDRCPSDLENIDEKLKSRISGGMIINFKNPDYQDRISILKDKAQLMKQEVCEKVLSYLAEKITTNVRDLEGALKKLIAGKVLMDEEITLENAKIVVADYVRASNATAPTVEKIQKLTASFYGIKISDLTSSNRARNVSRPRQVAMYLAKNFTAQSLPKIGKEFGKNHATVIHSVKLVTQMMNDDANFLSEIKSLEEKLTS